MFRNTFLCLLISLFMSIGTIGCISLKAPPIFKGIGDDLIKLSKIESGTVCLVNVQTISMYEVPAAKKFTKFDMWFKDLPYYCKEIIVANIDHSIREKIQDIPVLHRVPFHYNGSTVFRGIYPVYASTRSYNVIDDDWTRTNSKMDPNIIGVLNQNINTDYYLIATLRLANIELPDENTDFRVAPRLYLVMYNRQGEKVFGQVYTRVYTDTRKDINVKDPEIYIPLFKKLLDDSKEDINKDLSFLISFPDAKSPSIEDTYQEYLKKGTPTKVRTKVLGNSMKSKVEVF